MSSASSISSADSLDTSWSNSSKETPTTTTSPAALDGLNESFMSSIGGEDKCCNSPLTLLRHCTLCFGTPIQPSRRANCFVAVGPFQPPPEGAAANDGDVNGDKYLGEHDIPAKNIFTPLLDRVSATRRSLSPIQSLAGHSSANTLHKRADVSAGFFTLSTLEAIHSTGQDSSESSSPTVESRSKDEKEDTRLSSYKTPAKIRLNPEAFLEVTCEKGVNSDDDISQIEDDNDFDALLLNVEQQSSVLKSPGRKKLCFDANQETGNASPSLFPEIGKAIESFQAIVLTPIKSSHKKEGDRGSTPKLKHLQSGGKIHGPSMHSRQDLYLRKSGTFIKALRRSGCLGKCLIQGWVAFRKKESWREVSRCTARSDFRYVVLLEGIPTFYVFNSKPKQRKGEPAPNLFDNCTAIDLNKINVGVSLAEKALGNEVYLVDPECNKLICSMLPVAMKDDVFLNKHRSRLAKSDVLQLIFQDHQKIPGHNLAGTDQNDAARHLLFVLSAAITKIG